VRTGGLAAVSTLGVRFDRPVAVASFFPVFPFGDPLSKKTHPCIAASIGDVDVSSVQAAVTLTLLDSVHTSLAGEI
jgi:hypothetical protein